MLSHAFFQGLGFLTIGGIIHTLGTRDMRQMGGLRKAMPITFWLSIVVMLARTGVPPFASFFSKGFIISSLWSTGDVLLVLTIYASTAITFAYTLRFIILTFLREPSDHVKNTHLHEPPKTMLFASGILAVLCFAWGFLGPLIGKFMNVGVEMGISEVFSSATLVFLLILFLGGFPIYVTYYKKSMIIQKIRSKLLNPLAAILEHGYFFDVFYEKVVVRGVLLTSESLKHLEVTFFNRLPQLVANGVTSLAHNTQKYLDIFADELLYMVTNKTLASASKIGKMRSGSIEHYIAAALIGFLIILILIIITMLR
jgi:NADH-quinone oxidoreductase subunit L